MSTNKIFITTIEHTTVKKTVDKHGDRDTAVSAFWTFNNGMSVHIHLYVAQGTTTAYKGITISPFLGFDNKPYSEVKAGLDLAMKFVRAWVLHKPDKNEWHINYML